ncbi:sugar ABC transporter permease [Halalkalibacterium halodurans]|jgi:putative aldouronate transport system permease protein|nr:sugar ABC transporter permease [Halalkalibacterium halodurans]TPE70722.1 sugar ABC transporter permease [Halalkalibacterium halodurans]
MEQKGAAPFPLFAGRHLLFHSFLRKGGNALESQAVTSNAKTVERKLKKQKWNFRRTWQLHVLLIPALILALIFQYGPMFGIVMAFQDYKPWLGFTGSEWVGLQHFITMFEYDYAKQVIWNTLVISVLKMIFGLIVPIIVALLLNEMYQMVVKRTVQTIIYLPYFLSWVILGGILIDVLSPDGGIVNQALGLFGIDPIFFLGSNDWFRTTVVISDLWKETGFNTIVFLAAITAVNPNLYEAAVVDGANRWKQTLHITLPAMLPIIIVVATLSLGNILNAGFDQIFNLYNPLVYQTGDIIDTYVYRVSLVNGDFSYGTAVGLFKSLISLVLIIIGYRLAYKYANWRIF